VHGVSLLQRLVADPGKLAQIAYGLLPRDVFISVEQRTPGNLDTDEWAIPRRLIDLIQANAKGAELGPVLELLENAGGLIDGPPMGALAPDEIRVVSRVSRRSAPLLVSDPAKLDRLADQHGERDL
jgi:hypothetical protein